MFLFLLLSVQIFLMEEPGMIFIVRFYMIWDDTRPGFLNPGPGHLTLTSHKQQKPPCSTATCWEKECVDPSGSLSIKFGAHTRKFSGLAKSFMIRSGGSIESHMQNLMTTFSHTLQFSQFTFSSGLISPTFLGFLPRSWLSAAHGSQQINQVYSSQMYGAASLG